MFVGIYNYTVIITYLSLISAGLGMYFSANGSFKAALFCLLLSGLCDMIDGPVARTRKRTETEKKFGIQIDSLSKKMNTMTSDSNSRPSLWTRNSHAAITACSAS